MTEPQDKLLLRARHHPGNYRQFAPSPVAPTDLETENKTAVITQAYNPSSAEAEAGLQIKKKGSLN